MDKSNLSERHPLDDAERGQQMEFSHAFLIELRNAMCDFKDVLTKVEAAENLKNQGQQPTYSNCHDFLVCGPFCTINITYADRAKEKPSAIHPFGKISEEALLVDENSEAGSEFDALIPNSFDKPIIRQRLHDLIDGKQAAEAIKAIVGAVKGGVLLSEPTYAQMTNEFGRICAKSGYYRHKKKQFFDSELLPIIEYLKG